MENPRIYTLKRLIRLMLIVSIIWLLFIGLDYFQSGQTEQQSSIRIPLPTLIADNPYLIRYDQKQLVVMLYSTAMRARLFGSNEQARQHLVVHAYGTNLGCPLEIIDSTQLKETCSDTRYDMAGRALNSGQGFPDLRQPVYTFCPDYSCITINP